jgi:prephenate dehydratase
LEVFKKYGLNLTSISSRPSRVKPWNYVFFVEFMGHKDEDKVQEAVEELRKHCLELRVLGSWRDRQRDFQLIRTKKS